MKQIPTKHEKYKNMKTWISMKYARFQFKVCHDIDKVRKNLKSYPFRINKDSQNKKNTKIDINQSIDFFRH